MRPAGWLLLAGLVAPAGLAAAPLHLRYQGSLAGIRMIEAELDLTQDDAGYLLRTRLRSVGAFAVIARGQSEVISQGTWRGDQAVPLHIDSEGSWNGQPRRLVVEYRDGVPHVTVLVPADPPSRRDRAGPPVQTAGTIDGLGLMVGLLRQVAASGRCDQQARVFDGRGVAEFTMTTAGGAGAPGGPLRCDFTTRKIAGPQPDATSARTGHGLVQFASPGPGLPLLPVRIVFQTRWTGDAVLTLTAAS